MRILNTAVFTLLAATVLSAADIPRPAPSLKFTTIEGKAMSLADLKGKVVAVMFFMTTCPHCQETTKLLGPLYSDLKPLGLEIVGLAINKSAPSALAAFKETYQAEFPLAAVSRFECTRFAGLSVMAKFYVPYMFLIDRNGQIRYEHPGGDAIFKGSIAGLRSELDKLLKEGGKTS